MSWRRSSRRRGGPLIDGEVNRTAMGFGGFFTRTRHASQPAAFVSQPAASVYEQRHCSHELQHLFLRENGTAPTSYGIRHHGRDGHCIVLHLHSTNGTQFILIPPPPTHITNRDLDG